MTDDYQNRDYHLQMTFLEEDEDPTIAVDQPLGFEEDVVSGLMPIAVIDDVPEYSKDQEQTRIDLRPPPYIDEDHTKIDRPRQVEAGAFRPSLAEPLAEWRRSQAKAISKTQGTENLASVLEEPIQPKPPEPKKATSISISEDFVKAYASADAEVQAEEAWERQYGPWPEPAPPQPVGLSSGWNWTWILWGVGIGVLALIFLIVLFQYL